MHTLSVLCLPVEVMEECFRPLASHDLFNVIYVCRTFAHVGRLLLYRTIFLKSDGQHARHTISFLNRNSTVAAKISCAVLTTVPPFADPPWINPEFFKSSVNLRSLELRGFPFSRPDDQSRFISVLRDRCTKLSSFIYRPGVVEFPRRGFELDGLKQFTWQSSMGTIDLKLEPVLTAAIQSLTSISFEGMVVHRTDRPYDSFLKLHFPNLSTLALGSLIQTNTPDRTNEMITQFILAHESIEHLSLGRRRFNDMFFQFREALLTLDSLPLLKSLEGVPENVVALFRREVASLDHITSLSLFCCSLRDYSPVKEMLELFRNAEAEGDTQRRLSSVTHLRVDFDVHFDHRMPTNVTQFSVLKLMFELAGLCPSVTSWAGRLLPMPADTLSRMFEPFEHLESILLPHLSFLYVHPTPLDYFIPVAAKRRTLQHIISSRPQYTELEYTIYALLRDEDGELEAVDVSTAYDITEADIYDPTYPFHY